MRAPEPRPRPPIVSHAPPSDALRALLLELPARVPPERIDRLWLFQPRDLAGRENGLAVLSLLPDPDAPADRRSLLTLRYQAERTPRGLQRSDELAELGTAPAELIPAVIAGVLRRLGDGQESPRRGAPRRRPRALGRPPRPPGRDG